MVVMVALVVLMVRIMVLVVVMAVVVVDLRKLLVYISVDGSNMNSTNNL